MPGPGQLDEAICWGDGEDGDKRENIRNLAELERTEGMGGKKPT